MNKKMSLSRKLIWYVDAEKRFNFVFSSNIYAVALIVIVGQVLSIETIRAVIFENEQH